MKTYPAITPGQSASDAFAVILRHSLGNLDDWRNTARTWDDIEGVHQVRVSFRRLRSALSIFRPMLARDARRRWSQDIKALVDLTGMARDIDVLIDEGLPAFQGANPHALGPGHSHMNDALRIKRTEAYENVRAVLDSAELKTFRTAFDQWIATAGWNDASTTKKKRKRSQGSVMTLARRILTKQHDNVLAFGREADPNNPLEMHRLRIACKKLRYASEFFYPLFDGMDAFVANMKGLQDTLGLMHDAAVIHDLMAQLLPPEVDPELDRYVQALIAWRMEQYRSKAAHFQEQWATFERSARPWV
ncbi:CHAD domain-containing protein [Pseudomonadota bacterium]